MNSSLDDGVAVAASMRTSMPRRVRWGQMRPIQTARAGTRRGRPAPPPGAGAFALVLALTVAGNLLAHLAPRPLYVPVGLAVASAAVLVALGPGGCTLAD